MAFSEGRGGEGGGGGRLHVLCFNQCTEKRQIQGTFS